MAIGESLALAERRYVVVQEPIVSEMQSYVNIIWKRYQQGAYENGSLNWGLLELSYSAAVGQSDNCEQCGDVRDILRKIALNGLSGKEISDLVDKMFDITYNPKH